MNALKMRSLLFLTTLWSSSLTGEVSTKVRSRRQSEDYIEDRKVVCYYANWAVYRQGDAKFTPQNINPYLCTHLIYAFGGLGKDDTLVPFDEYQDIEKGGYGQFAALKTYNKDLKTMLAVGGWNEGSRRFSPLVADPDRRQVFIKSALRFLRQYNFDGIDLDWEYPTQRAGGRPQDKDNYATFIEEMKEAFESEAEKTGKARLQISMAVPASLEYAGEGYAIRRLNEALDFFNLLTYDYHAAQEPAVNHHSPLFRPDDWSEYDFRKDLNIDSTVKFYLEKGASRDKLVLGIPTYGRSYTLANPEAHDVSSPATGPGEQGTGTKENGYLAYYEICNKILSDDWDIVTPYPGFMGPYAHKDNQWVGFDDVDAVVEKAFYVAEEELGGIMFWTIDNDDFRGTCGKTPYPLIESAKEAMYSIKTSVKTKTSVSVSTSEQTSVKRLKLTHQELAKLATSAPKPQSSRKPTVPPPRIEFHGTATSGTTPAPPTTPRSGPAFKCRNEGFFPHPTSCKKYYWCLDTPNQGMVAHTFSCPQGLFFNQITDGCDFLRNVECGDKDTEEKEPKKKEPVQSGSSSDNDDAEDDEDEVEDPKSLKDILDIVKAAGGIEGLEQQIKEEEDAKKEQEDRRVRISSKTRSRLSQLLNKGQRTKSEKEEDNSEKVSSTRSKLLLSRATSPSTSSGKRTSANRSEASLNSLFSRLANKRRNQPAPAEDEIVPVASENSSSEETTSTTPRPKPTIRSFSRKTSAFRNRSRFSSRERTITKATTTKRPSRPRSFNFRSRFRNILNPSTPTTTTLPPPPKPDTDPVTDEPLTTLNPEDDESQQKITIVGAHLEPETPEEEPLFLGVFKPKDGIREKLRETLHNVLMVEMAERSKDSSAESEGSSTDAPVNTVTISKNTRVEENRQRETSRNFASRARKLPTSSEVSQDSSRYVTIQRGGGPTPASVFEDDSINQVLLDSGNEDQSHEDHVNDLVHDHHPEIHFRHLKPDLQPEISVFLPTMSTLETSTVSAIESVEQSSPAAVDTPTRSRSRSRYRRPTSQTSSRSSLAETRRTRLQVRRRNRVQTERTSEDSEARPTSASPRESPRQRVRERSRQGPAVSDNTEQSTVSRFSSPRRLISRARTVPAQSRAPTFRASNQRVRVRGGGRTRATTEQNTEPAQPVIELTESDRTRSDFIDLVEEDNEQENLLEGKLTRVDLDIATEGVDTVTTLTLNLNEENYEAKETTIPETEPVTISPGKFKPKFGSDTRNRLREKLRQELLQNKTREETGGDVGFEVGTDNFTDLSKYDTEFSDFDISTLEERDSATTAIVTLDDINNEYYEDNSQIQSRRQRRINEEDSFPFSVVSFERGNLGPTGSGNSDEKRRKLEDSLLRVGRSTVGGFPEVTTTTQLDTTTQGNIKPFLLKGGKGYVKDQQKFSPFRPGLASKQGENISGPTNSSIVATGEDSAKAIKLRKFKKPTNLFSQFGVKEVQPSVEQGSSESVNLGITLDTDLGPTQAPNSLTTTGLISSLPKLNSFKSEITSGKYKNLFKLRKERIKTTIATTITSQDSRIENVKSSEGEEDVSFEDEPSSVFRPTISDNLVPTDPSTTATPFFPTFAATSPPTSTSPPPPPPPPPVIRLTEQPRRQLPRRLEIFNLDTNNDIGEVRLGSRARARTPSSRAPATRAPATRAPATRAPATRAQVTRAQVTRDPASRATNPARPSPRQSVRTTAESLFQTTFARSEPREPVQPALAAALLTATGSRQPSRVTPSKADKPENSEYYEYEYYYDYLDDDSDNTGHVTDYDLVPLANKVRILSSGLPHCLDVGVFPHPFSCKKFVNCYRNPGQGITGSIYQCPSYLAFDPVGGRCNWVNEIVCTAGK